MKSKYVLLTSVLLISVSTFAQKDELKTLKKIYDKDEPSDKDVIEFKATISKAEPLLVNASEADKVYFNFYKANAPFMEMQVAMAKPENKTNNLLIKKYFSIEGIKQFTSASRNVLDFEKKLGKPVFTKDIEEGILALKPMLLNMAVSLNDLAVTSNDISNYKNAALILKSIYDLDPKETEKLYFAANYAVNAKDFNLALEYYRELIAINYTGEGTNYFAINVASKKEESFNSAKERELYIKTGSHEKPRDEKVASKRGEIFKDIALILIQESKNQDEVKKAIQDAKVANPNDTSFLIVEADYYYKINDLVTYKKLITEALEKKPNDVDLNFNLGVISRKANQNAEAEKYFKRVIGIDSKYANAYLSLAELKLSGDDKFITEMNKLGTSEKDNKRYAVLKLEREKMFKETLPYLEKAYELAPSNTDVSATLLSVYKALEMMDKVK